MATYDFIGKAKLPRGQSYPIGRSVIDALLDDKELSIVTSVGFTGPSDTGNVIGATYRAPRHKGQSHTLTIWVSAVAGRIRSIVQQLIVRNGFPTLTHWLKKLDNRQSLYSRLDHKITLRLETQNAQYVLSANTDDSQLWLPLA